MKTILTIDGGGVRGFIPAYVLNTLQERLEQPLVKHFDMIAGTSTGSIIAVGLATPGTDGEPRWTTRQILDFYVNDAPRIFSEPRTKVGMLMGSKYDSRNLSIVLTEKVGGVSFGDMITNVIIPSYDITNRRSYFFKSWKDIASNLPAPKIVTAACSAPLFFDPTPIKFNDGSETRYMIDGAVLGNNPTMCAYVEAKKLWGDEDLFIVSIGCGDTSDPIDAEDKKRWGAASWFPEIAEIFMDAPVNTVDYQLKTIAGDMYVRMQCKIHYAEKSIDNASSRNIRDMTRDAVLMTNEHKDELDRVASVLKSNLDKNTGA